MLTSPTLHIIGLVRSRLSRLEDCPKFGDEGAPDAWLEIQAPYVAAMESLEIGQALTVITWLHLADRTTLMVYPRGDKSRPQRGVFNTRSAARPNPLGLHEVTLKAINTTPDGGKRLLVGPLEALHGSYVLDIKTSREQRTRFSEEQNATKSDEVKTEVAATVSPVETAKIDTTQNSISSHEEQGIVAETPKFANRIASKDVEYIQAICKAAWSRGLLSGFNGNVSLRVRNQCLITCTGAAKGSIQESDVALINIENAAHIAGGKASSELAMHLEIYRNQENAQAIVHTHPQKLLALGLRLPQDKRLGIPVFEAEAILSRLAYVPDFAPGTDELAKAIGEAAKDHEAIWMERHGLVCWSENATKALALSEELEHLAGVQLQAL